MSIFDGMADLGHEQLVFCRDDESGLRAIIAIHSTALGPALGGVRLYPYASEADAVRDVLRLSRGMTYKAAVAGLDLGGGKAVIIGDRNNKSEAMFRSFGRHIALPRRPLHHRGGHEHDRAGHGLDPARDPLGDRLLEDGRRLR